MSYRHFHSSSLFIIALAGVLLLGLSACSNNTPSTTTPSSDSDETKLEEGTPSALSEIEIARRRVALRSIIRKGDYYQARNEALRSIEYYEQAHREIRDDPKVTVRLANAYFEVKAFRKAADLFLTQNLTDFDEPSKLRVIASILLDQERTDAAAVIEKLALKKETKEYLQVIITCTRLPDSCIDTIDKSPSKDVHLEALRSTIKNAQETSSDPIFVQALLIGKLYESKAFLAVKNLCALILTKRPDYRVVLKMAGYTAYEL
jgi:tetratricopeptide (TPR) repeat protein